MATIDLSRARTARCDRQICGDDASRIQRHVRSRRGGHAVVRGGHDQHVAWYRRKLHVGKSAGGTVAKTKNVKRIGHGGARFALSFFRFSLFVGTAHVLTVSSRYIAAQPKMMFGAHAARAGAMRPPAPT